MEPLQVVEQLLHVYDDISAELGGVLALLFVAFFVVIVVVFASMLFNARANNRFRNAQSDTLRTINELVRTQSDREEKATAEAKRLNDTLLTQNIQYSQRFADQAQRLTTIEVKVPIYESEIKDLKDTRDTLLRIHKEERDKWHKREKETEMRHLSEIGEIRDKFDQTVAMASELKLELAEVRAELKAREIERNQYREENQRVNQIVSELVSMQTSIDKLAKVIVDEFSKLTQFATAVPVVADGSGSGPSGDGSGRGGGVRDGYASRSRERRSADDHSDSSE